jgi:hypothetical protein
MNSPEGRRPEDKKMIPPGLKNREHRSGLDPSCFVLILVQAD